MPPPVILFPLGTASAIPTPTRNHSSLALVLPTSTTLLFDCGEGTQKQIQLLKSSYSIKHSKISKIFITHLHGDHVFGLVPLLATILNGAGGAENDPRMLGEGEEGRKRTADVEIFGPRGVRRLVRRTLQTTYMRLEGGFVVHELLFADEAEDKEDEEEEGCLGEVERGRDIHPDKDGFWRDFLEVDNFFLSAGEIKHSVPCIGYVLAERPLPGKIPPDYAKRISKFKHELIQAGHANPISFLADLQRPEKLGLDLTLSLPDGTVLTRPPVVRGRKIVVLGDTSDPSLIAPLAEGADVLVHEATNAHLPGIDPSTKKVDTYEAVEERAKSRGHSTPDMAGRFAKRLGLGGDEVREGLLVLNHFSSRYKDDEADGADGLAMKIMGGIRKCAESAWGVVEGKRRVVCARDGVKIEVKA
ncbi:Metallo-hydrolase/oxidoreductase [Choiromyces venosus 120613-1]|uniref:Metallo-hydrolase/oxidoreductase n=1 Tax=Choiromyces venosus 120613-1 TaxID=1336337 RepID=A0A3N4JAL3_9PEZI|nr:Metallo-hydrolase/oxidoreductase [Choiromyces venosus 120613-1]